MSVSVKHDLAFTKLWRVIRIENMTVSCYYRKTVERKKGVVGKNREVKHRLIHLGITVSTNGENKVLVFVE